MPIQTDEDAAAARTIETALVVGGGVMGVGIAQVLAVAGVQVTLTDHHSTALERAHDRVLNGRYGLKRGVARGKISQADAEAALARIHTNHDRAAALAEAPALVLECVWEDFALKTRLFTELDRETGPETILASNTSGFSITALSGAARVPERVCGWHWASPVPVMRLAEIVVHEHTSPEVTATVCALARRCQKNPIVVRDSPMRWGFVTSRLFMTLHREARAIVSEGIASKTEVDALMKDSYRWPAGPFELVEGAAKGWDPDAVPDIDDEASVSRNARLMGTDS
jgi:3-hydroxybutyryl-CoA dehydrogenase